MFKKFFKTHFFGDSTTYTTKEKIVHGITSIIPAIISLILRAKNIISDKVNYFVVMFSIADLSVQLFRHNELI